MTPRTAIALLALAGLTVAACGSDDDGSSGGSVTAADLDGRTFVSTEVTGYDLVEGTEINMTFLADSMSVSGGCNSMNGGFEIDEGVLTAGPFAATMMACDLPLMDQDTWLNEFLSSLPTIELDGETLTLASGDTTMTLDELQPSTLVDTTWTVTGTVANEAVSSVPMDATASITIADDGTVAVDTGCNTGSGSVEVGDDTLTFGPIATTKMACPPEQTELETSVLSVLQGEVTYTIDGDSLSLRSGEGADEVGLELTAG
ncbi:MAG TPA: META domain-containing protein [Ilumatobacteraceae bacterium]|jgi:heat shock protein HslJ|nr:META domain-containing protein [Ilumatobacteraceae bacterium]